MLLHICGLVEEDLTPHTWVENVQDYSAGNMTISTRHYPTLETRTQPSSYGASSVAWGRQNISGQVGRFLWKRLRCDDGLFEPMPTIGILSQDASTSTVSGPLIRLCDRCPERLSRPCMGIWRPPIRLKRIQAPLSTPIVNDAPFPSGLRDHRERGRARPARAERRLPRR